MEHLGDITKVNWRNVPPVFCVTGGSPCQDLSIAGKREGLAGERSGLYMVQIDTIKQLRKEDEKRGRSNQFIRPRYMVWENVVGAFSSNGGKDFASVLEEAVKVVAPNCPPVPVPAGGWPYAGCLRDGVGGRWSVAWRTHDAQYWGVPQRRRRISLVCDFGGDTAAEILFESESVSGDSAESRAPWEAAPGSPGCGIEGAGQNRMGAEPPAGGSGSVRGGDAQAFALRMRSGCEGGGKGPLIQEEKSGTLATGNDQTIFCFDSRGNGDGCTCPTITGDHFGRVSDYTAVCVGEACGAPNCMNPWDTESRRVYSENGIFQTLATRKSSGGDQNAVLTNGKNSVVRRLTPLECERLQGYPDNWTLIGEPEEEIVKDYQYVYDADGDVDEKYEIGQHTELVYYYTDRYGKRKKCSDSARYKALGNSIALPFWYWLLGRISQECEETPTLGSLFDGIGGFPLCWESHNGAGTALWASEIEDFPIEVTRRRFLAEG